jgi:Leucine-rich repeat (LRR) protein
MWTAVGFAVLASSVLWTAAGFELPTEETAALVDLYENTTGPGWRWHEPFTTFGYPWNISATGSVVGNPCALDQPWQGINCTSSCDVSPCNIHQLQLDRHQLIGSLPASLGALSMLQNLSLSTNYLQGRIPPALANLSRLQSLDLSVNALTGRIPEALWAIGGLQSVDLSTNDLVGPLPATIGDTTPLLTTLHLANNPQFGGSLPESLGALAQLSVLNLQSCALTGALPGGLWNLTQLTQLILSSNALQGTLPMAIGQLQRLLLLHLDGNGLHGALPSSLGALATLRQLVLADNDWASTIPASLGALSRLTVLDLTSAGLVGTVPASLGNCTQLRKLLLTNNALVGSLPPTLTAQLSLLSNFNVNDNALTGRLPPSLGDDCPLFFSVYVNSNRFTGPLPPSLGRLPLLRDLVANDNFFTGPLPDALGALSLLKILHVNDNLLNGTVPASLGGCRLLYNVFLSDNGFTGPVPASLGGLPMLEYLQLQQNFLTGTVPAALGNATACAVLYLYSNQLHGAVPTTLAQLRRLQFLDVASNFLTGAMPPVQNLTALQALLVADNCFDAWTPFDRPLPQAQLVDVSVNCLAGRLPPTLATALPALTSLYLDGNAFTGTLPEALNASRALATLLVSNNALSGRVPPWLFALPALRVVSLSSNCFTGPLPDGDVLCRATRLENLVLDGLSAAPRCVSRLLPAWRASGVRATRRAVSGRVPACLLRLPALTLLHLGGNALSGTLPAVAALGGNLSTLVLSGNVLTGDVPAALWRGAALTTLDVSFNRLRGTLPAALLPALTATGAAGAAEGALYLQVNELSGRLPAALRALPTISVLEGNLFSCARDRSDLPLHDPQRQRYSCGADATYAALAAVGVAVAVVVAAIVVVRPFRVTLQLWRLAYRSRVAGDDCDCDGDSYGDGDSGRDADVRRAVDRWQRALRRWLVGVVAVVVCVAQPTYAALSATTPTYAVQYVWASTALYVQGEGAGVALWCVWAAVVAVAVALLPRDTSAAAIAAVAATATADDDGRSGSRNRSRTALTVATVAVNVAVVTAVNAAYVSAVATLQRADALVAVSFALSLFKVAWSYALVHHAALLAALRRQCAAPSKAEAAAAAASEAASGLSDAAVVGVGLFNALLAPWLAEIALSPNCFYYALQEAPTLHYAFSVVTEVNVPMRAGNTTTTVPVACDVAVQPPFHYSFQCASTLLANYVYVFVFRVALSGVVRPAVTWALVVWRRWRQRQRQRRCPVEAPEAAAFREALLATLLPLHWQLDGAGLWAPLSPSSSVSQSNPLHRDTRNTDDGGDHTAATPTTPATPPRLVTDADVAPLCRSLATLEAALATPRGRATVRQQWLARVAVDLALLLAFGALCPLLAALVAGGVAVDLVEHQLATGHLCDLRARLDDLATAADTASDASIATATLPLPTPPLPPPSLPSATVALLRRWWSPSAAAATCDATSDATDGGRPLSATQLRDLSRRVAQWQQRYECELLRVAPLVWRGGVWCGAAVATALWSALLFDTVAGATPQLSMRQKAALGTLMATLLALPALGWLVAGDGGGGGRRRDALWAAWRRLVAPTGSGGAVAGPATTRSVDRPAVQLAALPPA